MPILFKTQVNRAVNTRLPRCHARVGGLCGFQDTVERVPHRKPEDRTLRRRVGALRKWQTQKKNASGRISAEGEAASGEAGQSRGVVRAPRRSHLPAVRAVSGICEDVPKAAKISSKALQYKKSPPFQGKRRGSNEKYGVKAKFALWITPECKQHVLLLR